MPQMRYKIEIERVGGRSLIRQKRALLNLMGTINNTTPITPADCERLEGLLNFLDTCTDAIKDGRADGARAWPQMVGPSGWEQA